MKTVAAGKFKDLCLKMLDEVEESRQPVVITKRGRPVAKLVPVTPPRPRLS
jgi:prevent-host-death family protein